MSGGFGAGGFGSVPWGGSTPIIIAPPPPSVFDIFCFVNTPLSMGLILTDPNVTTFDSGGQLTIDLSNDLVVGSGGSFSTDTAILEVSTVVPSTRMLEAVLQIDSIPPDFNNLADKHLFIGTTSGGSTCAGFFISAAGIAYVGGVHYSGDPDRHVILDSTIQVIPGSSTYIGTGRFINIRVAIDASTQTLYLYVTDEADFLATGNLVLRAILPTIDAGSLAFPPIAATIVSARGSGLEPTVFELRELCLGSTLMIANLAPVADAGTDRSVELCSIIRLDGTGSFDPEGANLIYRWSLIDAPPTSEYTVSGSDGQTFPLDFSGFTNKFYSVTLGNLLNPLSPGDVLLVNGVAHIITSTGSDINGFFVVLTEQNVPDSLGNAHFKLLRQNGILHPDQAIATFMPDVAGFYRFELIVNDGLLDSAPATVVFNVVESLLPRGVVPDVSFIFGLISDFWGLVEDRDRITTLWSGVAQVASAELLTLWQHEYSKSLRDIQRQFTRKWLHYDLLLPEPLPELTVLRAVYGGLYSAAVAGAFTYSYGSTNLTIVSPALAKPASLNFPPGASASFPFGFAAILDIQLKMIDPRFSVRGVSWAGGSKVAIAIYAPFAFQIAACTLPTVIDSFTSLPVPLFQLNALNPQPGGFDGVDFDTSLAGAAVSSNTFRVHSDVSTFGVKEDDFLCIDGVAYRISMLTPLGDEMCDIIVKETFPTTVGHTWTIASSISSELLDFWGGLVSAEDVAFLEIAQSSIDVPSTALQYELFRTTVLGVNESLPSKLPISLVGLPADPASTSTVVYLAKVLRRRYIPISNLVIDVPTLSEKIVVTTQAEEEAVIRRNVDFTLESIRNGTGIHFVTLADNTGLDVWEGKDPPDRLWAEFTFLDNRPTIEANFGIPVEFTLDDLALLPAGLDYLSAVRGLWYAYFNGPTLLNLRIGTQILLGLPFAEEAGTIEEIRTDFSPTLGRILIRDTASTAIVRSYTYPRTLALEVNSATKRRYAVGDSVAQFAPLIEGASVVDYVKDPKWFNGILNQGIFREVEKYFRFLVKVDSAAFHLSALLAVRDFVLKVKPTYTYPLIVVESGADREDDISIDDTVIENVTLTLSDTPCGGWFDTTTIFDHYNGGGFITNFFDADADPGTPLPTFPTSDTPILWAFDKEWLCPEDNVVAEVSTRFAAPGPALFGQCFFFGQGYTEVYKFLKTGGPPISVPAGPSSLTIPPDPNDATAGIVATAGTLVSVKVRTQGPIPAAPNNTYVLFVDVNGSPPVTGETFSMQSQNGNAVVPLSTPLPVAPADVVTVRIRVASGPTRNESWTRLEATVYHSDSAPLVFGQTMAPGTYRTIRQLSP